MLGNANGDGSLWARLSSTSLEGADGVGSGLCGRVAPGCWVGCDHDETERDEVAALVGCGRAITDPSTSMPALMPDLTIAPTRRFESIALNPKNTEPAFC